MSVNTPFHKDYIFVGIQLFLFAGYVVPLKLISLNLPEWLRYSGLVVLVLGVVLGLIALLQINTKLSPFPTPVANGTLITNGAFAISRHPIYTAIVLSGFGYAFYLQSTYKAIVTFALLLLFYFKSRYEEELLSKYFPNYHKYKSKTRRFL